MILDLLLGYLIGSILGGTLFKYISRTDLAQVGSGNIGARNAHRAGGLPAFYSFICLMPRRQSLRCRSLTRFIRSPSPCSSVTCFRCFTHDAAVKGTLYFPESSSLSRHGHILPD